MTPLVSVIVVNWNGRHLLGDCLDSLRAQTFKDFDVILVDNGSIDGSVDFVLDRHWRRVKIISLPGNSGFAAGNNFGIREARGKYIVLLNNDAIAHRAWLGRMVEVAEKSVTTGMWTPKIYKYRRLSDREEEIESAGGLVISGDGIGIRRTKENQPILVPSGCAAMYRKSTLDEIGLFDEKFFAYCEDTDLGLRARAAGWGCVYVPTAIVYHKGSSTATDEQRLFLSERNRLWVLWRHFSWWQILISPYYTFKRFWLMWRAGEASNIGSWTAIKTILRAWIAAIRGKGGPV